MIRPEQLPGERSTIQMGRWLENAGETDMGAYSVYTLQYKVELAVLLNLQEKMDGG